MHSDLFLLNYPLIGLTLAEAEKVESLAVQWTDPQALSSLIIQLVMAFPSFSST